MGQLALPPSLAHGRWVGGAHHHAGDRADHAVVLVGLPGRATPAPGAVGHRLVEADDGAAHVCRVQVPTADVVEVATPHHPHPVGRKLRFAPVEVVDLVDRHVAAVAVALVEQPTGSGARLRGRDDFQELVADHHQGVA